MKRMMLCGLMVFLAASVAHAAENPYGLPDGLYAEIRTARGVVVGELYYKRVPLTVANYVGLAEGVIGPGKGKPFFDGARIVRVDFVIETGETRQREAPFADEMVPGLRHDGMGVMEMANDGPGTNGTYWCFMMEESERLNYLHTVFGKVVKGMEVLPLIKVNDTIQTLRILRVGAEAEKFVVTEESFAALAAKGKKYDGPKEPGAEAYFDDADKVLPQPGAGAAGRYNRGRDFNFKLGNFHLFTGKTVKVRVVGKMPSGLEEGGKMGAYMEALAMKLGMEKEGALAVYFADKDAWEVRVGAESVGRFLAGERKADGRLPGAAAAGKSMEVALGEFLAEAKKEGEALIEKEAKGMPAGQEVAEGQKVKLKVDGVVDGLIFRLE